MSTSKPAYSNLLVCITIVLVTIIPHGLKCYGLRKELERDEMHAMISRPFETKNDTSREITVSISQEVEHRVDRVIRVVSPTAGASSISHRRCIPATIRRSN